MASLEEYAMGASRPCFSKERMKVSALLVSVTHRCLNPENINLYFVYSLLYYVYSSTAKGDLRSYVISLSLDVRPVLISIGRLLRLS